MRFQTKLSPLILFAFLILSGCERPDPSVELTTIDQMEESGPGSLPATIVSKSVTTPPPTAPIFPTPTLIDIYLGTPTPDPTQISAGDLEPFLQTHIVSFGETLTFIAGLYNSTVEELTILNDLDDGDLLGAGQELAVPGGQTVTSPSNKLIPNSELVYGPAAQEFDIISFVNGREGFIANYREEVEGELLSGAEIVQLIAERFSVNPRLLLALVEYQSGWLDAADPFDDGYPMGYVSEGYEGLYKQLSWVADKVNFGYYGRAEGGLRYFEMNDELRILFAPDINDGTAGLQLMFASIPDTNVDEWSHHLSPEGFPRTYGRLFGNPFAYTVDPLWETDIEQPDFILPFSSGDVWYFTGGPHGGWGSGSAWAALDFTPSDGKASCQISEAWVLAVADGLVTRSEFGAVVLDLNEDGFAGTGWSVIYMHLASEGRISEGTSVRAGDAIGRPSCEGGFSNATHLHLARTYNGRWVSADGDLPFVLGDWISQGLGREYDGLLVRGEEVKEACQCEEAGNQIISD